MLNVGNADRAIRAVAGLAFILLPLLSGWSSLPWLVSSEIAGIVLLATAIIGFCPIYAALGLSSKRRHPSKS